MKLRAVGIEVAGYLFVPVVFLVFAVGFAGDSVGHQLHMFPSHSLPPTPVLVAKQLIPKGTPGLIVATKGMYAPTTMPVEEVEDGAIIDPHYFVGRDLVVNIVPGEQLTASDFTGLLQLVVLPDWLKTPIRKSRSVP